jgi:hypothetical protein
VTVSVLNNNNAFRKAVLGNVASKATGTITVATLPLFTITGKVALTALVGEVTTAITVAGTTLLQANPTTGVTGALCTATDLGTTDTPAGDLLGIDGVVGSSIIRSIGWAVAGFAAGPLVINAGTIEMVTATGADGAITWYVTWVPLTDGALLVAA